MVGEGQVRYCDRVFCGTDRKRRMRASFPGAGVREVGDKQASHVRRGSRALGELQCKVERNRQIRSEEFCGWYREALNVITKPTIYRVIK